MATTRAKVWVREITQRKWQRWDGKETQQVDSERILFGFVTANDPTHENYKFWEASPSGEFWIDIANPAVIGTFKLGEEYYLDLIPVPESE